MPLFIKQYLHGAFNIYRGYPSYKTAFNLYLLLAAYDYHNTSINLWGRPMKSTQFKITATCQLGVYKLITWKIQGK